MDSDVNGTNFGGALHARGEGEYASGIAHFDYGQIHARRTRPGVPCKTQNRSSGSPAKDSGLNSVKFSGAACAGSQERPKFYQICHFHDRCMTQKA